MKKSIFLLCGFLGIAFAIPAQRIVGGENANPGQFKYMASLQLSGFNIHFCGGSIINKRTIVTAAHCKLFDVNKMVAVVGTNSISSGGQKYNVQQFITHPDYDEYTIRNDIALVILSSDIVFDDLVQPILLPVATPSVGAAVNVSGWGLTSYPSGNQPDHLQWIKLRVLNRDLCKEFSSNLTHKICTLTKRGEGICSGDSGGPLVENDQLVGIVSSGYPCALGFPDFFTDVYAFNTWINENAVN